MIKHLKYAGFLYLRRKTTIRTSVNLHKIRALLNREMFHRDTKGINMCHKGWLQESLVNRSRELISSVTWPQRFDILIQDKGGDMFCLTLLGQCRLAGNVISKRPPIVPWLGQFSFWLDI